MALTQADNIAWFEENHVGSQQHFYHTAIITVLMYSALFSICQTTSLPRRLFSTVKQEHVSTVCSCIPCCLSQKHPLVLAAFAVLSLRCLKSNFVCACLHASVTTCLRWLVTMLLHFAHQPGACR